MPGILSGTVTIFAWTLSAFATPQLVGGGKVNMISNMVYQVGFSNFDFPFAAVLSLAALALIFAILGLMSLGMRRLERVGLH
jgi:putative spermidine/putrescine transport system permease protein